MLITIAIISSLSAKTQLSSVFFMLVKRLKPEGAKYMKKGRCGNILEPQSTALLMAALR